MSQSRWDRFFFLGFVGIFFFIFVSTESSANGNYNVAAQFPFSLSLSLSFSFSIKKKGPDGPVSYFEWPSLRDHSLLPQTKKKRKPRVICRRNRRWVNKSIRSVDVGHWLPASTNGRRLLDARSPSGLPSFVSGRKEPPPPRKIGAEEKVNKKRKIDEDKYYT